MFLVIGHLAGDGANGLKFPFAWTGSGHNNIKQNPVFRRMP